MLQSKGQLDFSKVFRILCTCMIDNKEHVRAVGLEAMAVMNHIVGQQEFLEVSWVKRWVVHAFKGFSEDHDGLMYQISVLRLVFFSF